MAPNPGAPPLSPRAPRRDLRDDAHLSAERPVRGVVLTGSGSIFSAGVDLPRLLAGGRSYAERFVPALDACFLGVFGCDKPVVAAMNGHAIAGGCVLAAACDLRLMSAGPGRVGVPEMKVGVPFPAGVAEILRFALPAQHLSALMLRGGLHEPAAALERGLVDEIVPADELIQRALAAAAELAEAPPAAFAASKRRLRGPAREQAERLSRETRATTVEIWASDEVQAAVRRFVDRTLPRK